MGQTRGTSPTWRITRLLVVLSLMVPALVGIPAVGAAEAAAGAWIDTSDRASVVAAYEAEFGSNSASANWTGAHSGCAAGTTSQVFRDEIVRRVNFFRGMAGVPATVVENAGLSAHAQQTALMMSASNALSHSPPQSVYDCWTSDGAKAAGKSNLYLGQYGPASITGYMNDPGSNNAVVGHRNWILHPPTTEIGTGDVPAGNGYRSTNALYVITDAFGAQPAMRESDGFVAWPPRGYVPGDLVFDRWSFGLRNADFSNATVTVSQGGTSLPVSVEHRSGASSSAPFPIMVWNVAGIDTDPTYDQATLVTVANVVTGGQSRDFSYVVNVLGDGPPPDVGAYGDFVDQAFADFLGRQPSASERTTAIASLSAGVSQFDFVRALAASPEWTSFVIEQMYLDTLGRSPDAAGQSYWAGRLQNDLSVAQVASAFYGSPEYIQGEGGTFELWLADLYGELLLRSPESSGLTFWVGQANARGPGAVALDFYQSQESREARVRGLYQQFLGRDPDASGLEYWSGVLASGDDLALAAFLASSPEYFDRAG